MPNALVVADDLTGTLDTGHGFAVRGRGVTAHLTDGRGDSGTGAVSADRVDDVLAVDTDTREASRERAAAAVRSVRKNAAADVVYKKVDSTLRGNVVAEVEAALAAGSADLALVAPAFPGTGRTTRGGIHYVDDTPLAQAGYGVAESHLPTLFGAATGLPVEHVPLTTIEAGPPAVLDVLSALPAGDPVIVTCDAVTGDHLATIADAGNRLAADVCYVGSGGLAGHVSVPGEPTVGTPPASTGAGVLAVVGSVNPRSLTQLGEVPDDIVVSLDPAAAVRDPAGAAASAASRVGVRLRESGEVVLTAATEASDVERAETAAEALSGPTGAPVDPGEQIANALAGTVARALAGTDAEARGSGRADVEPRGLVLTGGDVARAVLDRLAVTRIGLTGEAVTDGLPVSWIDDGPIAGTRLVTKAGGFGDRMAIVNSIREVGADHE